MFLEPLKLLLLRKLILIVLSCIKKTGCLGLTKFHYKTCEIKNNQFQYFLNLPHIISVVCKVLYFEMDCSKSHVLR